MGNLRSYQKYLGVLSNIYLLAVIAGGAFVSILLLSAVPKDFALSYSLIQCFGEQIMQLNFYPRWCMNMNGGYGSPAPIFYFPLPYYFSTLFYPLRYFGFDILVVYVLSVWLISSISFINVARWLGTFTTRNHAIIGAILYLFFIYRVELLSARAAFAELCCMAFLPLLFMELRAVVNDKARNWHRIAMIIAVCMLMHAPITAVALMACGIYLLAFYPLQIKGLFVLLVSAVLAYCATLFHWQATTELISTLNPRWGGIEHWKLSWVNSFAHLETDKLRRNRHLISMVFCVINILLFVVLIRNPTTKTNAFLRRELKIWLFVSVFAIFMIFPISSFLWDIIEMVTQVKTPWRALMLLNFATIFFIVKFLDYGWAPNKPVKKWHIFLLFCVFLGLSSQGITRKSYESEAHESRVENFYELLRLSQETFGFFNPKWIAERYVVDYADLFFEYFVFDPPKFKTYLIASKGTTEVKAWGYDGIKVHVETPKENILQIEHFYYPTWYATINGKPATIKPEENNAGRMLIEVPAGVSEVVITQNTRKTLSSKYHWICLLSLFSFLIICAGYFQDYWARGRRKNA